MSDFYLLDTNSAIARLKNDAALISILRAAEEIYVPSIVLGELYFGAYKSIRREENVKRIEEFMEGRAILPCDEETALVYAQIRHQLQSKGRPIPQNDLWIAAIARQHDLTLVTRDAHFGHIDDLKTRSW